jgi:hypothetical protein
MSFSLDEKNIFMDSRERRKVPMRKRGIFGLTFLLYLALLGLGQETAESGTKKNSAGEPEDAQSQAVRVFLDGKDLSWDYIRTEIPFVNYVRDRRDADVHVLIARQGTGSGGTEFALAFIGQGDFSDLNFTQKYVANKTDVPDEILRGIVHCLKGGLAPFIGRTPLAHRMTIGYDDKWTVQAQTVKDRWNFWVFSLNASGSTSGVKTRTSGKFEGNFSANRVTPDWKLRFSVSGSFDASRYTIEESVYKSSTERETLNAQAIKSLGDHWSAGVWFSMSSASFNNIKLSSSPSIAVEYSFFPYAESSRRQLYLQYRLSFIAYRYREATIYDRLSENIFHQRLSLNLEYLQPWGNANASIGWGHYLQDVKLNKLAINAGVSVRLIKGLSFWAGGRYEAIHDQITLPKAGATLEQILLMRKDQATTYSFSLNLGLNFTFGSMYSNVINPRFD